MLVILEPIITFLVLKDLHTDAGIIPT